MFEGLTFHSKHVETLSWTLDTKHLIPFSDKEWMGDWFNSFEIPQGIRDIFREHGFSVTWNHVDSTVKVWNAELPKIELRHNPHTLNWEETSGEDVPVFVMKPGDTFHFGTAIPCSLQKA